MTRPRYEYWNVRIQEGMSVEDFTAMLNKIGFDGWLLVGMAPMTGVIYLARQMEQSG